MVVCSAPTVAKMMVLNPAPGFERSVARLDALLDELEGFGYKEVGEAAVDVGLVGEQLRGVHERRA
jgi:hypothetical protein